MGVYNFFCGGGLASHAHILEGPDHYRVGCTFSCSFLHCVSVRLCSVRIALCDSGIQPPCKKCLRMYMLSSCLYVDNMYV